MKKALCNYKLSDHHFQYDGINNLTEKIVCQIGYIKVGYKCLRKETQANLAVYVNRCYNFYPFYLKFYDIENKLLNGYFIELSFKIDLLNYFCINEENDEYRYLFYTHPHAIIKKKEIYYLENKKKMILSKNKN